MLCLTVWAQVCLVTSVLYIKTWHCYSIQVTNAYKQGKRSEARKAASTAKIKGKAEWRRTWRLRSGGRAQAEEMIHDRQSCRARCVPGSQTSTNLTLSQEAHANVQTRLLPSHKKSPIQRPPFLAYSLASLFTATLQNCNPHLLPNKCTHGNLHIANTDN